MTSLISKVSGAVSASARSVSRATRSLLVRGRRSRRSNGHKKEREAAAAATNTAVCEDDSGALWRRDILMGERCEPLNFSGAIHYDSQGRPIWQPRRRAMAAKMLCRSSNVVDDAVVTYPRK
ncbi:hypothetical protein D1007_07565 [Hordeum vulgare]|uniref:Uncharacterized protein n=1 Tax=Hordeum vulgare subsp. vulgare TaxID=112509 RepID=A0A8I6XN73_HORVV|nr:uncharacterized protein LOC123439947 [Hordeum vulgare subsp. vulgare]KAE8815061.1 hypothetical protein D1007_07565 [Hordeum vulgare]KAI5000847.1 hypothetical protein ZWY2020_010806 [Hordeum vulgare]